MIVIQTLDTTKITNLIKPFETRYISPFFHTLLF